MSYDSNEPNKPSTMNKSNQPKRHTGSKEYVATADKYGSIGHSLTVRDVQKAYIVTKTLIGAALDARKKELKESGVKRTKDISVQMLQAAYIEACNKVDSLDELRCVLLEERKAKEEANAL